MVSAFLAGVLVTAGCANGPPERGGLQEDRLAPCPDAPHCVSSQAPAGPRRIEPLAYPGTRDAAREALLAAIRTLPRTKVLEIRPGYVHAIQRSAVFGFIDDLECVLPEDERFVHVRSASRVGYYDFGVNRARVERLRAEFRARMP
jgi:uncharacterized protein (DUF1499 family)